MSTLTPVPTVADRLQGARGRDWQRVQLALAAAIAVLFVVLAWLGREPPQIAGTDDLVYHALSRSLDEGSYREIFRESAPVHVKYPPGYPAWMSLVRAVGGEHPDVIVAANLALATVALVLFFLVARRFLDGWLALAAMFLAALSPGLLWMASLFSEGPFFFFATAALALAVRADRGSARAAYGVGALALAAFLIRLPGLALIGAVGWWIWFRGRWAERLAFGAATVVVLGGWGLFVSRVPADVAGATYATDIASGMPESGALEQLVRRAIANIREYATAAGPTELSFPSIPGTLVDNVGWLVVASVLFVVGFVALWRCWRITAVFVAGSCALMVAWTWPVNRLLFPLIPFLLMILLLGAQRVTARLAPVVRRGVLVGFIALLTMGASDNAAERIERFRDCDRRAPLESAGCYDAGERRILEAAAYLSAHVAPDAVVVSSAGQGVFYISGHRSEPDWYLETVPPAELTSMLRAQRLHYVLLAAVQPYEYTILAPLLAERCHEFTLVTRFGSDAMLLSPEPPVAATANACVALTDYRRAHPPTGAPGT